MKSLINKICRVISIISAIVGANVLFGGSLYEALGSFWGSVLPGVIFGTVIKKIVFDDVVINRSFDEIEQDIYNKVLSNMPDLQKIKTATNIIQPQATVIQTEQVESDNTFDINNNQQDLKPISTKSRSFMDMVLNTGDGEIQESVAEPIIEQTPKIESQYIYREEEKQTIHEQSKIRLYITNFFAENALAKIGGLLLFLGAMFFVGLIYTQYAGGVGKMIIGFLMGFGIYGAGIYLDRKNLKAESQICLGTGIAINYLVILGARYLIDGGSFMAETGAFIFLIMNTLLAVATGMIYRSNIILIFGFLLAYLSPILVGGRATSPIFVSTYAAIVSIGAIGLSYYINNKAKETETQKTNNIPNNLLRIAFVGGLATFVLALVGFPSYRIEQTAYISIIGIATIIASYIYKSETNILSFMVGTYICILLAMFMGYDHITNPFLSSIYIFVLFIANIYMSSKITNKLIANTLLLTGFAASMITFITIPFASTSERIFKLIMVAITGIVSLYIGSRKSDLTQRPKTDTKQIGIYILGSYVSVIALMMSAAGQLDSGFSNYIIYISYSLTFLAIGAYTIYIVRNAINNLITDSDGNDNSNIGRLLMTLFIPLIIMVILLFVGVNVFVLPTMILGFVMIISAIIFSGNNLPKNVKYILFGGLGIYILAISGFLNVASNGLELYQNIHIGSLEYISTIIVSFALLAVGYWTTYQDDMESAYPLSTLMHILILLPILHGSSADPSISVVAVAATLLVNVGLPIINTKINTSPLATAIGIILGALFVGGEIYRFDMMGNGIVTGGVSITGIIYIALALVYFLPAVFMILGNKANQSDNSTNIKNTIYTYMGVSISSLAIALAFVFADNVGILALSRISLASIIMYIYTKIKEDKIYLASIIMYGIGLRKMFAMIETIKSLEYTQLIPLGIIGIFDIVGLYFIRDKKDDSRYIYDVLHLISMGLIGFMMYMIIPHTGHGRSTIAISGLMLILSLIYSRFYTGATRYIYILALILLATWQLFNINEIFNLLKSENITNLKILQYISTALIAAASYIQYRQNKDIMSDSLLLVMSLYLFGASTIYIYDIFQNTFAISIYWGIVAYILLHFGIARDEIKFRTIGLYVIGITLAKVGLYDIRYGIDSGIMRVVALMILGGLLIYISTLYTRKYGGKMSGELNPINLIDTTEKVENETA